MLVTLNITNKEISNRIFDCFDKDKDGLVQFNELANGLAAWVLKDDGSFARFLFDVADVDNSGKLTQQDLQTMIGMQMEDLPEMQTHEQIWLNEVLQLFPALLLLLSSIETHVLLKPISC